MLSNKQKMDLLMESLQAVEGNNKTLNEDNYKKRSFEIGFDDSYSNDEEIAFLVQVLMSALARLSLVGGDDQDGKKAFVAKTFKAAGIDIDKLQDQVRKMRDGGLNYPPEK